MSLDRRNVPVRGHLAEPLHARGLVVGIGFEVGGHLGYFHLNFEVQRAEFTEGSRRRPIWRWLSGRKIFRPDVLFPHSPRRYFDSVPTFCFRISIFAPTFYSDSAPTFCFRISIFAPTFCFRIRLDDISILSRRDMSIDALPLNPDPTTAAFPRLIRATRPARPRIRSDPF